MDIDQLLESIVGKDNLTELENEVKELEARSTSSSRPQTPSYYNSQQSLASAEDAAPGSPSTRHKSFILSPSSVRRTEIQSSAAATPRGSESAGKRYALGSDTAAAGASNIGKRYALGSDNLEQKSRQSSTAGKRYALGSDTLEFSGQRRNVIGAERQNGHSVNDENNTAHEKPDISEIFKIIDKTRLESESNNRSPTDDISGRWHGDGF